MDLFVEDVEDRELIFQCEGSYEFKCELDSVEEEVLACREGELELNEVSFEALLILTK